MNTYDILSRVFDLVSNFNFFNDMPSIFQDRLEAFDVVERRTKDMAEQLEARFRSGGTSWHGFRRTPT